MPKAADIYIFGIVRFIPSRSLIEIGESGQEITLSQTHCSFLFTLANKPKELVTYDQLREKVWPHEPVMDVRVRHTIHSTKRDLAKLLRVSGATIDLIESVAGKGYKLNADVIILSGETNDRPGNPPDTLVDQTAPSVSAHTAGGNSVEARKNGVAVMGYMVYIVIVSLVYGLLYLSALVLEIAYRINHYAHLVVVPGLPILLTNSSSMVIALIGVCKMAARDKYRGLVMGSAVLLASTLLSVGIASVWLPNTPITLMRYQAQPASAAFFKSALIYFFPMIIFFVLIPFYSVIAKKFGESTGSRSTSATDILFSPRTLLYVFLAIITYSLITTFRLLDNLEISTYHWLFVWLIFVRFFLYFGLASGSLVWYQMLAGPTSKSKPN